MSSTTEPGPASPPGDSPLLVRRAKRREHGAVAATLAAAFHDDPVFGWLYAEEHRAQASRLFFEEILDALASHDSIWTTEPQIVGAAVWIPFGRTAMSPERGEQLRSRMSRLPGVDHERAARLGELVEANSPSEPHEYLRFLGVLPTARGAGVGSLLMAPLLRHADEAGHPAHLVSTSVRSKALYERHGFVAREPLRPDGGPRLWPMWREPR